MIIKTDTLEPIIPSGDKWNIEFDIISRQLNINSLPTIVSGDNNSNIILIKTPLYYNDIDLSTINCVLRYKTDWRKEDGAINEGQIDLTTSITKFDDYIIYTWVLDQRQTLYRGNCIISLEYFMNLTEDPYQNQAKFYLTKISDENGDYLQIGKDELTTDIEKKYWSISSLPLTFSIGDGGNIAEGIEPDDNIADSGYDDGYAQGYEDGYNKGNMLYYVTTCNSLYGGAVFPENTEIVVKVKNVTNYGYMFSNVLNVKSIKMIYKIWFNKLNFSYLILAIIGILSGSLIFWVNRRPETYEMVLSAGVFFVTLGFYLMFKAIEHKEKVSYFY